MQWAMLSSFLALRALAAAPSPTRIFTCRSCGFRWCERGLAEDEAGRLYADYRGEAYFRLRHSLEPWYSRAMNDGLGAEASMVVRRAAMLRALSRAGVDPASVTAAADHGGDRGQLLLGFERARKAVYEVSGVALEPGVERIPTVASARGSFDLVLTCHVLEHLNDPAEGLDEAASLARAGGTVFLELPREQWTGPWQPAFEPAFLEWLAGRPGLLKAVDFICTGARIKGGVLPPLGFLAIREHLNFFTIAAIRALMDARGIEVLLVEEEGEYFRAVGRVRTAA